MQWQIQERGPGPPPRPLPLFLDQTEARRAEKKIFEPRPPLSQGLDDRPSNPAPLSEGLDPPLNMCALRKPLFVIEITEEASYN